MQIAFSMVSPKLQLSAAAALLCLWSATPCNAGRKGGQQNAGERNAAEKVREDGTANKKDLEQKDKPELSEKEKAEIQKRIDDRNTRIDAGVKQFPDSPVVNTAGSEAALNSRDVPKALNLGDKAVQLAKQGGDAEEVVPALTARAQAKLANHDKKGALADIAEGLELKKDDRALLSLKGLIMGHAPGQGYKPPSGDFSDSAKAAAAKDSAAKSGPGWTGIGGPGAGDLHKQAQATKEQLERTAALNRAGEGMELDPRKSLEKLDELLKGDPKDARVYALRAKADRLIGQYKAAHGDATTAIGLDARLAMAYAERAVAGALLGYSEQEYMEDWKAASHLDPLLVNSYESVFAKAKAAQAATAGGAPGSSGAAGGTSAAAEGGVPAEKKAKLPAVLLLLAAVLLAAAVWAARRARPL
jgi:hypothetical protein